MTPAPESLGKDAADNFSKLKQKLRELFQLDRGDLDFGLYRIMAFKSAEVGDFLDNHLLPQVTEALGEIAESDTAILQRELESATKSAQDLGVDPEDTQKVKELKNRMAAAKSDQQTEADTYNHLYNFFARYYDEGDFMSLRRYKGAGKAAYAIPYNGEEVKLHWANSDQYYIKTTENYASYVFIVGNHNPKRRVRFEIAAADAEKDNIKEADNQKRVFILAKNFLAAEGNELIVRFDHRPLTKGEITKYSKGRGQQERINKDSEQRVQEKIGSRWKGPLAAPCPTEKDEQRTLLGKHLAAYTAKNSFDYFIHKDLGGFLRRELDYYLKSEVLSIDNLELTDDSAVFARSLAQIKAIKQVGDKIIDFLAQLENFQKQLWLKKKFVLETHYCVTLDKAPESLYAEIAKNQNQHDEWVKLFAIDELNGEDAGTPYSKKLKPEFLKENPYLVLDTRHFDQAFTDKLLAALSEAGPVDEQMNGLLVHGENFQALNNLQEKYKGKIQCIHIDPPYNTKTSGFLYKNEYKHSSWLTMMENRIGCSLEMISEDGLFLCHIDENEYEKLHLLIDNSGLLNAGTVVWDKRNPMTGGRGVANQHEYVICRQPNEKTINLSSNNIERILKKAKQLVKQTGGVTEETKKQYAHWVRNDSKLSGGERAYCFLDNDGFVYQSVSLRAPEPRLDRKFFKPLIHPTTQKPCPVPPNGFSRTPETLQEMLKRGEIVFGVDETTQPRQKRFLFEGSKNQITSVMQEARRGKVDLDKLGSSNFPYSHSVFLYADLVGAGTDSGSGFVLDYFAGSGTTGHAVINLNREDDGDRKYILVEMGNHFQDVLLPRMKKVAYSKEWKDGKPQDRQGVSQLFKYIRLESYEDTLDSLTVRRPGDLFDESANAAMFEDYQLRYALGAETAQSASLLGQDFTEPLNYTLSVVRDGVRHEVTADIAETFNFLLGLRLTGRRQLDGVLTITGTTAKGENCLILWRNCKEMNAAKLDDWFRKHRNSFGDDLNLIYVNGDHTLNTLRQPTDKWEAITTEPVFRELMFAGAES